MLNEFSSYTNSLDVNKNDLTHKAGDRGYCPNGADLGHPIGGSLPAPSSSSWNYPYLSNLYGYYNSSSYNIGNVHQYENQKCATHFTRNYGEHPMPFHSTSVLQCCDPRCQLIAKHSKYSYHSFNSKLNQRSGNKRAKNYYGNIDFSKPDPTVAPISAAIPSIEHAKYTHCVPYSTIQNDLSNKYNNQLNDYCSPFANNAKQGSNSAGGFNEYYTDIGDPSYWNKTNANLWNRNTVTSYYPPPPFEEKSVQKIEQNSLVAGNSRGILLNRLLEHRDGTHDIGCAPNYYYGAKNDFSSNFSYGQPYQREPPSAANDNPLPLHVNNYQPTSAYSIHYPPCETVPPCHKENIPKNPPEPNSSSDGRILEKNPNLDVREFLSTWEDDVDDEKVAEGTNENPVIVLDCTSLESDVLTKVKEKLNENNVNNEDEKIMKIVDVNNDTSTSVLPPHTSVIQENSSQSKEVCNKLSSPESSHMNSDGYMTWYSNGKKKEDFSYDLVEMTERLVNTVGKLLGEPEKIKPAGPSIPPTTTTTASSIQSIDSQNYKPLQSLSVSSNEWNSTINDKKSKCDSTAANLHCSENVTNSFQSLQDEYNASFDESQLPSAEKNISCTFNLQKTSNDLKFSLNYTTQQNDYNMRKIPDIHSKSKNIEFSQPYYNFRKNQYPDITDANHYYKDYTNYSNYYGNTSCTYDQAKICNSNIDSESNTGTMNYVDHLDKHVVSDTDITLVKADLEKSLNEMTNCFKPVGNNEENNQQPSDDNCNNVIPSACKDNATEACNKKNSATDSQGMYNGVIQKTGVCNSPLLKLDDISSNENNILSMPSLSPPPTALVSYTSTTVNSSLKTKELSLCAVNLTLNDVYENDDVIFGNSEETGSNEFSTFCYNNQTSSEQAYQPLNLAVSRSPKLHLLDSGAASKVADNEETNGNIILKADDGYYSTENTETDEISAKNLTKQDSACSRPIAYHSCIVSHEHTKHKVPTNDDKSVLRNESMGKLQCQEYTVTDLTDNSTISTNKLTDFTESTVAVKSTVSIESNVFIESMISISSLAVTDNKSAVTQSECCVNTHTLLPKESVTLNENRNQSLPLTSNINLYNNEENKVSSHTTALKSKDSDDIVSLPTKHTSNFNKMTDSSIIVEKSINEPIINGENHVEETILNLKVFPHTNKNTSTCDSVIKENESLITNVHIENNSTSTLESTLGIPQTFTKISPDSIPKSTEPFSKLLESSLKSHESISSSSEAIIKLPELVSKLPELELASKFPEMSSNLPESIVKIPEPHCKLADSTLKSSELISASPESVSKLPLEILKLNTKIFQSPKIDKEETLIESNCLSIIEPETEIDLSKRKLAYSTVKDADLPMKKRKGPEYMTHTSEIIIPTKRIISKNHSEDDSDHSVITNSNQLKNDDTLFKNKFHKSKKKRKKDRSKSFVKHQKCSKFRRHLSYKGHSRHKKSYFKFESSESLLEGNDAEIKNVPSPDYNEDEFNIPSIAPTPQCDLIRDDYDPLRHQLYDKSLRNAESPNSMVDNNGENIDSINSSTDIPRLRAPSPNCILQEDTFANEKISTQLPSPIFDQSCEVTSPSSVAPSPNYDIIEGVLFDDTDWVRTSEDTDYKCDWYVGHKKFNGCKNFHDNYNNFSRMKKYTSDANEYESDYISDWCPKKRKRNGNFKNSRKFKIYEDNYRQHKKRLDNRVCSINAKISKNTFKHFDYAVDDERFTRSEDDEYEPKPNYARHIPKNAVNSSWQRKVTEFKSFHNERDEKINKLQNGDCNSYFPIKSLNNYASHEKQTSDSQLYVTVSDASGGENKNSPQNCMGRNLTKKYENTLKKYKSSSSINITFNQADSSSSACELNIINLRDGKSVMVGNKFDKDGYNEKASGKIPEDFCGKTNFICDEPQFDDLKNINVPNDCDYRNEKESSYSPDEGLCDDVLVDQTISNKPVFDPCENSVPSSNCYESCVSDSTTLPSNKSNKSSHSYIRNHFNDVEDVEQVITQSWSKGKASCNDKPNGSYGISPVSNHSSTKEKCSEQLLENNVTLEEEDNVIHSSYNGENNIVNFSSNSVYNLPEKTVDSVNRSKPIITDNEKQLLDLTQKSIHVKCDDDNGYVNFINQPTINSSNKRQFAFNYNKNDDNPRPGYLKIRKNITAPNCHNCEVDNVEGLSKVNECNEQTDDRSNADRNSVSKIDFTQIPASQMLFHKNEYNETYFKNKLTEKLASENSQPYVASSPVVGEISVKNSQLYESGKCCILAINNNNNESVAKLNKKMCHRSISASKYEIINKQEEPSSENLLPINCASHSDKNEFLDESFNKSAFLKEYEIAAADADKNRVNLKNLLVENAKNVRFEDQGIISDVKTSKNTSFDDAHISLPKKIESFCSKIKATGEIEIPKNVFSQVEITCVEKSNGNILNEKTKHVKIDQPSSVSSIDKNCVQFSLPDEKHSSINYEDSCELLDKKHSFPPIVDNNCIVNEERNESSAAKLQTKNTQFINEVESVILSDPNQENGDDIERNWNRHLSVYSTKETKLVGDNSETLAFDNGQEMTNLHEPSKGNNNADNIGKLSGKSYDHELCTNSLIVGSKSEISCSFDYKKSITDGGKLDLDAGGINKIIKCSSWTSNNNETSQLRNIENDIHKSVNAVNSPRHKCASSENEVFHSKNIVGRCSSSNIDNIINIEKPTSPSLTYCQDASNTARELIPDDDDGDNNTAAAIVAMDLPKSSSTVHRSNESNDSSMVSEWNGNKINAEIPSLKFLAIQALSKASGNNNNNNMLEVRVSSECTEIIIRGADDDCGSSDFIPDDADSGSLIMTNMLFDEEIRSSPNFDTIEQEMSLEYPALSISSAANGGDKVEKNDEDLQCQCLIISSEESILCLRCSLNSSVSMTQFGDINDNCKVLAAVDASEIVQSNSTRTKTDYIEQSFIEQEIECTPTPISPNSSTFTSNLYPPIIESAEEVVIPQKTQIKVQLPWQKIFNLHEAADGNQLGGSNGREQQRTLELGPAQIEVRMLSDEFGGCWKNANNAGGSNLSPVVKVRRLVVQRGATVAVDEKSSEFGPAVATTTKIETDAKSDDENMVAEASAPSAATSSAPILRPQIAKKEVISRRKKRGGLLVAAAADGSTKQKLNEILGVPKMVIKKTSCRRYKSFLRTNRLLQPVIRLVKNQKLDELALKYCAAGCRHSGRILVVKEANVERCAGDDEAFIEVVGEASGECKNRNPSVGYSMSDGADNNGYCAEEDVEFTPVSRNNGDCIVDKDGGAVGVGDKLTNKSNFGHLLIMDNEDDDDAGSKCMESHVKDSSASENDCTNYQHQSAISEENGIADEKQPGNDNENNICDEQEQAAALENAANLGTAVVCENNEIDDLAVNGVRVVEAKCAGNIVGSNQVDLGSEIEDVEIHDTGGGECIVQNDIGDLSANKIDDNCCHKNGDAVIADNNLPAREEVFISRENVVAAAAGNNNEYKSEADADNCSLNRSTGLSKPVADEGDGSPSLKLICENNNNNGAAAATEDVVGIQCPRESEFASNKAICENTIDNLPTCKSGVCDQPGIGGSELKQKFVGKNVICEKADYSNEPVSECDASKKCGEDTIDEPLNDDIDLNNKATSLDCMNSEYQDETTGVTAIPPVIEHVDNKELPDEIRASDRVSTAGNEINANELNNEQVDQNGISNILCFTKNREDDQPSIENNFVDECSVKLDEVAFATTGEISVVESDAASDISNYEKGKSVSVPEENQIEEMECAIEDVSKIFLLPLKDDDRLNVVATETSPPVPKPELHHCLLCHRSYKSVEAYGVHVRSRFHRYLELMQRKTVHELYCRFTGRRCPGLRPLSVKERKKMKWKPRNANANHFYHRKTPLQIALRVFVVDSCCRTDHFLFAKSPEFLDLCTEEIR